MAKRLSNLFLQNGSSNFYFHFKHKTFQSKFACKWQHCKWISQGHVFKQNLLYTWLWHHEKSGTLKFLTKYLHGLIYSYWEAFLSDHVKGKTDKIMSISQLLLWQSWRIWFVVSCTDFTLILRPPTHSLAIPFKLLEAIHESWQLAEASSHICQQIELSSCKENSCERFINHRMAIIGIKTLSNGGIDLHWLL